MVNVTDYGDKYNLHAIRFLREYLNDQFLVIVPPAPHLPV